MVAQDRGDLDKAADWYAQSLAIKEALGNRPGMAKTYAQLGLLADLKGSPEEALTWTVRCVSLFAEFPHPATGPGPHNLAVDSTRLGIEAVEKTWLAVNQQTLPDGVRAWLLAKMSEFEDMPPETNEETGPNNTE